MIRNYNVVPHDLIEDIALRPTYERDREDSLQSKAIRHQLGPRGGSNDPTLDMENPKQGTPRGN
jgi:hypothetical protein